MYLIFTIITYGIVGFSTLRNISHIKSFTKFNSNFFFLQITGKSKDPQTMQRLLILSFFKIKNEIESLFLTHVITKSRLCIKKTNKMKIWYKDSDLFKWWSLLALININFSKALLNVNRRKSSYIYRQKNFTSNWTSIVVKNVTL